jgi:hypothetical protein
MKEGRNRDQTNSLATHRCKKSKPVRAMGPALCTANRAASTAGTRGGKGFHKRLIKVIDIAEVLPAIILGFAEYIVLDQIEYDVTEVGTPKNTPIIQYCFCQRSILINGIGSDSVQQFTPCHVLGFSCALGGFPLQFLDCLVQGLPYKGVGLSIKTRVLLADKSDDFSKFQVLHDILVLYLAQPVPARNPSAIIGKNRPAQVKCFSQIRHICEYFISA